MLSATLSGDFVPRARRDGFQFLRRSFAWPRGRRDSGKAIGAVETYMGPALSHPGRKGTRRPGPMGPGGGVPALRVFLPSTPTPLCLMAAMVNARQITMNP